MVGRVTPCAPRLQPECTNYPQRRIPTPMRISVFPCPMSWLSAGLPRRHSSLVIRHSLDIRNSSFVISRHRPFTVIFFAKYSWHSTIQDKPPRENRLMFLANAPHFSQAIFKSECHATGCTCTAHRGNTPARAIRHRPSRRKLRAHPAHRGGFRSGDRAHHPRHPGRWQKHQ